MKPFIFYTTNIGLCSQLSLIIKGIILCKKQNREFLLCTKYGMYPDLRIFFETPIKFIEDIPPGLFIEQNEVDTCFPSWDYPNAPFFNENMKNLEILLNYDASFEEMREIALTFFKPKIEKIHLEKSYDAVHIRRGDQILSGENGMKYIHAMKFIDMTQLNDVFVMSDDYRVINEIHGKNVHTIIPKNLTGHISTGSYYKNGYDIPFTHKPYEEKLHLTKIFLQEVYTCAESELFIAHFTSAVPNFIKLIHKNPDNCIKVIE